MNYFIGDLHLFNRNQAGEGVNYDGRPFATVDEMHQYILEFTAIRQEMLPDILAMTEEAKQALSQAGELLTLKKRVEEIGQEQNAALDRLLADMGDAEPNTIMMPLTKEKESLKAKIAEVQQVEVSAEEQAARHRQMWGASRRTQKTILSSMRNLSGSLSRRPR